MASVGTVISVVFVLTLKVNTKEKVFLAISQFKTVYIVNILSLIVSGVYIFADKVPDLAVYIAVAVVYGFAIISILKVKVAVAAVEGVDEKIKVQTLFVKSLTVDTEHLMNTAKTSELKSLAKKVYEAVRYSDPMSNAVLVEVEDKIENGFADFESDDIFVNRDNINL